jgi:hypothetical protein
MPRTTSRPRHLALILAAAPAVALVLAGCDEVETADAASLRETRLAASQLIGENPDATPDDIVQRLGDGDGSGEGGPASSMLRDRITAEANLAAAHRLTRTVLPDSENVAVRPGLAALQAESAVIAGRMERLVLASLAAASQEAALARVESGMTDAASEVEALADAAESSSDGWSPTVGAADTQGPYAGYDAEIGDNDRAAFDAYTSTRQMLNEQQVATVAAIDARLAEAQQNVAELESEIEQVDATRRAALERAGEAETASLDAKGQAAVDAARRVADARTEAGQTQGRLETLRSQLSLAQKNVEQLQAQRAAVATAAEAMRQQASDLRSAISAADGLQGRRQELRQQVESTFAGGTITIGDTQYEVGGLGDLAAEMDAATTEADALREEALLALDRAKSAFQRAKNVSGQVGRQSRALGLSTASAMADAGTASGFASSLGEADALRARAMIFLGDAATAAAQLRLARAAEQLESYNNVSLPSGVSVMSFNEAASAMEDALREAAASLQSSADAAEQAQQSARTDEGRLAAATSRAAALDGLLAAVELQESLDGSVDAQLPSSDELGRRARELAEGVEGLPRMPRFDNAAGRTGIPAASEDEAELEADVEADSDEDADAGAE